VVKVRLSGVQVLGLIVLNTRRSPLGSSRPNRKITSSPIDAKTGTALAVEDE
jgi:hypothetical protein